MSIITMLYLADFVENTLNTMLILAACSGLYFTVSVIHSSSQEKTKTLDAKIALTISLASLTVLSFLPSKKTVYMMAAASYTKELAENPKVTELGDKIYRLLNEKLDEALGEK